MAALFLIRHAQPAVQGTFLGQLNPPLSPSGHEQARRVLHDLEVEAAYVSPLLRARETAVYLRSAQLFVIRELQEIGFGEWTGRTWQQIQTGWPELAHRKALDWTGVTPPSGESWADFTCRVRSAWLQIRSGPSPAAVIAHGGVNGVLASFVDGRSPLSFRQDYMEITRLEYEAD
jgi:alpha-ribazole phosphatase